jgi:hypothetical protein
VCGGEHLLEHPAAACEQVIEIVRLLQVIAQRDDELAVLDLEQHVSLVDAPGDERRLEDLQDRRT